MWRWLKDRGDTVGATALVLASAGCFDLPEFASPTLIDRPRVLSVVANPPEISSTGLTQLSVVVAGTERVSVTWYACARFDSFVGTTQYGENSGEQGCSGEAPLGRESPYTALGADIVGEGEQDPAENPELAAALAASVDERARESLGGLDISGELLTLMRATIGIAYSVQADILTQPQNKRLRAVKRVLISDRLTPHSNPPAPVFDFRDQRVAGGGDRAAFRCSAETPLHADPGERVTLRPFFEGEGDEEPWLETYNVLDATGMLGTRRERAFYSWYATAGELEEGTTEAPERENYWAAPGESRCAELWLVVRDGHGGENACGVPVAVGDAEGCEIVAP
ncbi:MAG: hypothetical protein ABW321_07870 [Polyangiales bacterium]